MRAWSCDLNINEISKWSTRDTRSWEKRNKPGNEFVTVSIVCQVAECMKLPFEGKWKQFRERREKSKVLSCSCRLNAVKNSKWTSSLIWERVWWHSNPSEKQHFECLHPPFKLAGLPSGHKKSVSHMEILKPNCKFCFFCSPAFYIMLLTACCSEPFTLENEHVALRHANSTAVGLAC